MVDYLAKEGYPSGEALRVPPGRVFHPGRGGACSSGSSASRTWTPSSSSPSNFHTARTRRIFRKLAQGYPHILVHAAGLQGLRSCRLVVRPGRPQVVAQEWAQDRLHLLRAHERASPKPARPVSPRPDAGRRRLGTPAPAETDADRLATAARDSVHAGSIAAARRLRRHRAATPSCLLRHHGEDRQAGRRIRTLRRFPKLDNARPPDLRGMPPKKPQGGPNAKPGPRKEGRAPRRTPPPKHGQAAEHVKKSSKSELEIRIDLQVLHQGRREERRLQVVGKGEGQEEVERSLTSDSTEAGYSRSFSA